MSNPTKTFNSDYLKKKKKSNYKINNNTFKKEKVCPQISMARNSPVNTINDKTKHVIIIGNSNLDRLE